ncbi:MAG: hypothetical protein IJS62_00575 [Bacteroidales bacterium]|nr:hypothetical protein [Bacteroidales bacterium]
MKRRVFTIILFLAGLVAAAQTLPAWQKGYFDIHHIAIGKGECQFLIFPDGTTMMIDCGDMTGVGRGWAHSRALPDSTLSPTQWAARYVDAFSPTPGRIDYFALSHFHADHMGHPSASRPGPYGYRLCGITELGEYEKIGTFVDRGYPSYDFPSVERVESQCGMMKDYKLFIARQVNVCGAKAERFEVGSRKQFGTKEGKWDFEVWNVASGLMLTAGGRKTRPMYKETENPDKFDENMFSHVLLFRYGDFKYFSGGDLCGSRGSAFGRDYESQVAPLVAPCNVLKANHHGYRDATNPNFLWQMAPDVIVVDAVEASHPRLETAARIADPMYPGKRQLYATSEAGRAKMGEDAWPVVKGVGHIVIRVYEGGGSYQVFVLDATSGDYPLMHQSEIFMSRR